MVKKLCLIGLVGCSLLFTACELLNGSLFPAHLSQIEASSDIARYVDGFTNEQWRSYEYRLSILTGNSGTEYLFLLIRERSSAGDDLRKVIVLNTALEVKKEYESASLEERSMVDAQGNFVIGNISFSQVNLAASDLSLPNAHRRGFSDGSANYILFTETDPGTKLRRETFDKITWTSAGSADYYVSSDRFRLEQLSYDRLEGRVVLFFRREDSDSFSVTFIPAGHFPASLQVPILDYYPNFSLQEVDNDDLHYTRDGIVARDHDERYTRYDFSGQERDTFTGGEFGPSAEAYDLAGEYYYLYSVDDRRIYKCHTWW